MADTPRRLGRGLEALIATSTSAVATRSEESALQRLPIQQIRPNPFQPRKEFKEEDLAELELSIRTNGLLQPVSVRPSGTGGYELIAGERRLRAASRLGWSEIPAIISDFDDRTLLTLALIENLQRTDLNPVEEAEGYRRLLNDFSLTQQQVADAVGKDRSTVANALRLLGLPASVRRLLQGGQLTVGHARALLGLPHEHLVVALAEEIVAKKLSVREIERRVRDTNEPAKAAKPVAVAHQLSPDRAEIGRITDDLRRRLQTDVQLVIGEKNRGEIRIRFYSADDLERLLELIGAAREEN